MRLFSAARAHQWAIEESAARRVTFKKGPWRLAVELTSGDQRSIYSAHLRQSIEGVQSALAWSIGVTDKDKFDRVVDVLKDPSKPA